MPLGGAGRARRHLTVGAPGRLVLRAGSGVGLWVVVVAFCVFLLGDALVRGAFPLAASALPWLTLIVWAVFLLLVRPCVVLDDSGITVVNVLRVHHAPWSAVETVRSRFQVRVELVDGRVFRSWGAPSSTTGGRSDAVDIGSGRRTPERGVLPIHRVIDRFRDEREHALPASSEPATSRWDLLAVALTAAIVLWCVFSVR